MRIQDIEDRVETLKNRALRALEVPEEAIADIHVGTPPQPEMGDRGFPCFVLARHLRKAPPVIAEEVAEKVRELLGDDEIIDQVRAVGPYVNMIFNTAKLARVVVSQALDEHDFGADTVEEPEHWMFEYSAPNTNKPQHLGHVRNDLLGQAVSQISDWAGHRVTRVNLINDRGIHICKSMLAYQEWGEDTTPEQTGEKGDHLVGRFYVQFNQKFSEEYDSWRQTEAAMDRFLDWLLAAEGIDALVKELVHTKLDTAERNETSQKVLEQADKIRRGPSGASPDKRMRFYAGLADYPDAVGDTVVRLEQEFFEDYQDDFFNRESKLGKQAKEMLRRWEAGDEDTVELWERMNQWVFDGFDETYARLGVAFDRVYRESQTYQLGKKVVVDGLEQGKFEQLDDGAVVCDLEKLGLQGQKVLLRSDGTSVYMTQDIGTALERFREFDLDKMVYVVGNEQDYHFQVLFKILGLLEPELDGRLHHLSYGMVLLPEGKMKSREGTVVDADELMDEMEALAGEAVLERWPDLDASEVDERARAIGMAALKYYILDFNPRTTVNFDPKESIDFQGRTGPYCLYSYARIQSIGRRMGGWPELDDTSRASCLEALGSDLELALVRQLQEWPQVAFQAARDLDPSKVTAYLFTLCKSFSTLYNDDDHKIVDIEDDKRRDGLLYLSRAVAQTLKKGLGLLGIEPLEAM